MITNSFWCLLLCSYWSIFPSLPGYWSMVLLLLISFLEWKLLYTSCSTEGGEFPVPYIFKKDESSPGWEYTLIDFKNMWTWLLSFQHDPLSAQIREGVINQDQVILIPDVVSYLWVWIDFLSQKSIFLIQIQNTTHQMQ